MFETRAEQIQKSMKAQGIKYTKVPCSLCGRYLTTGQLAYSKRFFGKPLCRSCQRLEDPLIGIRNYERKNEGYASQKDYEESQE